MSTVQLDIRVKAEYYFYQRLLKNIIF